MKKYKIISHQIVFYEYEVQAESMEEAKDKVESWGTPEDGVKLISKDTNHDDFDPIIHLDCEEIIEYPFEDGDTYYTLDGDEWIESCWDTCSEEIHDENPDKVYYTAPNKESRL